MTRAVLSALFPQWRDRDDRLCREIVARGICAPTSDLGTAVRACLARVDSLRLERDDMWSRWGESHAGLCAMSAKAIGAVLSPQREKDRARIAELEAARDSAFTTVTRLRARLDGLEGIHRDMLRVVGERDEARRELEALRASVRDVARRMAEQVEEVSNG